MVSTRFDHKGGFTDQAAISRKRREKKAVKPFSIPNMLKKAIHAALSTCVIRLLSGMSLDDLQNPDDL